jgi:predicted nucleotidyltransferase component of viral defense system
MISLSVIKELAQKLQTTEQNVRREYIQNLFLSYLYQHPKSDAVFFKGGTALRIINKSPRFSEDLDFSSTISSMNTTEDIIVWTVKEIAREGIDIEIVESKKTSGGHLGIIHFSLQNTTIALQLEISQRRGDYRGEFVTIVNEFIPPYTLMALSQEQLVAEKIQALISRRKPRDFYDLYYILRADLLPVKGRSILREVSLILDRSDLQFEQELKMFLPKSHWQIIRDFGHTLGKEIRRAMGE